MNSGLFIVAFGSVIFKKSNQFASGGINGFAIVLQYFVPQLPIGVIMLVTNILLLLSGFFIVNKGFIIKSIYGSVALSLFTWLIEIIVPFNLPLTNQKLLELIFGVILAGIGSTLAFYKGASTGGTDILAMILKKFFKVKISLSLLTVDMVIAFASGLVYGIETMFFSIFGVIVKIFVMDLFLENIQSNKIFTIVADEKQSIIIQKFIMEKMGRSATVSKVRGAFSSTEKFMTISIMEKGQAIYLQNFIDENAPNTFVAITTSNLILGRGFTRGL